MDTFYQELIGSVLQLDLLLYNAWACARTTKRSYDLLLDTSRRVSDDRVYVDR